MDKLIVKKDLDKSSVLNFVKDYVLKGSPETYDEKGNLQCAASKRSGLKDLVRLVKSYFNEDDETIKKIIIEESYKNGSLYEYGFYENIFIVWCNKLQDFTIGKANYDDGLKNSRLKLYEDSMHERTQEDYIEYYRECINIVKQIENKDE